MDKIQSICDQGLLINPEAIDIENLNILFGDNKLLFKNALTYSNQQLYFQNCNWYLSQNHLQSNSTWKKYIIRRQQASV